VLNCKLVRIAKAQTGKWLFSTKTLNGCSKKSRRSDFSYYLEFKCFWENSHL